MSTVSTIAVACDPDSDLPVMDQVQRLADRLGITVWDHHTSPTPQFLLMVTQDLIELWTPDDRRTRPIMIDLTRHDTTSRAGRDKKQPLAKAIGLMRTAAKRLHVLDATAGYGQDTWLLASFGCRVTALERSGVLAALLEDGLRRAGETHRDTADRIELIVGDAIIWLKDQMDPADAAKPDVVYMDPVFPESGSSALNRRPMRVLRELVGDDEDAIKLFEVAREFATQRVIVKRPAHAEPLGGAPTTTHHAGRAVRYDVYVTHNPA